MDLTLVNLNMLYVKYLDGSLRRQNHLPLGPLYLVSVLREKGFAVDFRDYQLLEGDAIFTPEALCDFLADPAPVVGISCMANLMPFVAYAMPFLRERYPDRVFVIGGVGAIDIERELMERVPSIDVIHRGEGERSVPLLMASLRGGGPLADVPNIFYRESGAIRGNPPAERIAELDSLPLPSYDGLDFNRYAGHNMLGSRGCPYQCTFCSIAPIWGWRPHLRSVENIVGEMVHMHREYGVRQFLFQDEFFISSPERTMRFARLLAKEKLDITYKAFARVDLVDGDSLQAMADTGCVEIRFGIESGSDRILDMIRKDITSQTAMETVALAKRIMRSVDAFFVWGFPFETMKDFSESVFQMIAMRGMGVHILPSLLTYLPQTRLYRDLADRSLLEFCPFLLPEFMICGMERRVSVRVDIDGRYGGLFDFIVANKDIFPGFFQVDVENNVLPKLAMLEEFEFYRTDEDQCCGAHSPEP
ncbi:MAG TPA: radical SAM protein [Spirochaetota bacterium]|nr:radical SAM protein [Spirochaetota bacterium]HNT11433.1 radical SAM protein [Spirochaetota bacterium]